MRVVITGGTGFLGRGLLRHFYDQHELIVLSRDEYKQDLCRQRYPNVKYVLGDVTDYDRLYRVFDGVDMVIHTAAIKYIPEAEFNVDECIDINVEGSRAVLQAAYAQDVSTVVGISTDKACLPINVYGMTKALMERLFGDYARTTGMHCALARYGNVIGSTGSVIPKFKQQLEQIGHISLTDPHMTRYWITMQEAVKLVEMCFACENGSIIIPKPRAMTMGDLAYTLVADYEKTHGCLVGQDRIVITGIRPGEKRHEALLHQDESIRAIDYRTHYELRMIGTKPVHNEPFILSSNTPQGGWISSDELLHAVRDAELV